MTDESLVSGEVVYLFAYDVAHELQGDLPPRLLGESLERVTVGPHRRHPRTLSFHASYRARLPRQERHGPCGSTTLDIAVTALPIGAVSVTVRMPVSKVRLRDLVGCHEPSFDGKELTEEICELVEKARRELLPWAVNPVDRLAKQEAYTVFVLDRSGFPGGHVRTSDWLQANRRDVAALLVEEHDPDHLAEAEVVESTARTLSYYDHDLMVADWDASLIIDDRGYRDELLHAVELANLQLVELEAYDTLLDRGLERAYRDLAPARRAASRKVLAELRDLRIDLTRLGDEIINITKFFGDWHLARVHGLLAERFHLADWHRSVEGKLRTLDELWQVAVSVRHNRQMLFLEWAIVLLFVLDLVILVFE